MGESVFKAYSLLNDIPGADATDQEGRLVPECKWTYRVPNANGLAGVAEIVRRSYGHESEIG